MKTNQKTGILYIEPVGAGDDNRCEIFNEYPHTKAVLNKFIARATKEKKPLKGFVYYVPLDYWAMSLTDPEKSSIVEYDTEWKYVAFLFCRKNRTLDEKAFRRGARFILYKAEEHDAGVVVEKRYKGLMEELPEYEGTMYH